MALRVTPSQNVPMTSLLRFSGQDPIRDLHFPLNIHNGTHVCE